MSTSDNQKKADHGSSRAKSFEERLQELVDSKDIVSFTKGKRFGYKGYKANQFYAPFEIEFGDGSTWVVYSTTQWRDRYKENEWDAFNIKQIDQRIEHCYISLSNIDEETKRTAERENAKRETGEVYSFLDGVFLDEEMFAAIEEKAYDANGLSTGSISNKKGARNEQHLVRVMKSKNNLKRWKNDDGTIVGRDYSLFLTIVNALGLDASDVIKVEATDDIPKLATGGKPKTDVAIYVYFADSTQKIYTVSCKRSRRNKVSAMQFDASDLIEALDIKEKALIDALHKQQECGSSSELILKYGAGEKEILETFLPKYLDKMLIWILGGVANPTDKIQVADWMLTRRDNKDGTYDVGFHSVREYADAIRDESGQYSTPFQWTYHNSSGKKQIQLKIPLVL